MQAKKNLNRDTVRMLRKVQKFLMEEPKRFNMYEGIRKSEGCPYQLEQPPCGTACCILGAMYIIDTGLALDRPQFVCWAEVWSSMRNKFPGLSSKLYYDTNWPSLYLEAYKKAKNALERACIGVARIEHYIYTDGQE